MKKKVTFCILGILFFSTLQLSTASTNIQSIDENDIIEYHFPSYPIHINNPSLIDNYTWSVMRYDFEQFSDNHGGVSIPTPSSGTVLILANMMSLEVCRAAISVQRETKMETLQAFDAYDSERMIHTAQTSFKDGMGWNTDHCHNYRKESAIEMNALGEVGLYADLVGECYAQASFNTAVLRLCGFSPEEVFTIGIQSYQGGHAINVINVDDEWYVFDSTYASLVRNGMHDSLIFEKYVRPPFTDHIVFLENDKYFINFGTLLPYFIPTMKDPYLNMNEEKVVDIIEHVRPLFNNSLLGKKEWAIDSFIENATPNPWMKTISIPYTTKDAEGSNVEEQAYDLARLCQEFICSQDDDNNQDQYDKSCYALGLLSVDYPQVYANAAKLAAWTSWYAIKRDMQQPFFDIFISSLWIRATILNRAIVPEGCVAYADLLHLCHMGSSLDKAVLVYGTLRNMKKNSEYWEVNDLYVVVTDEGQGYLAVNWTDDWRFISFEQGRLISDTVPDKVTMVFNEIDYFTSWEI